MAGDGWFDADLNGDFEAKRCLSSFVDEGSVESHRYYLARRTLLEMLRDRGYSVPDSDIDMSLQDFRSVYTQTPNPDRLRISASLRSDPSKKVSQLHALFSDKDSILCFSLFVFLVTKRSLL